MDWCMKCYYSLSLRLHILPSSYTLENQFFTALSVLPETTLAISVHLLPNTFRASHKSKSSSGDHPLSWNQNSSKCTIFFYIAWLIYPWILMQWLPNYTCKTQQNLSNSFIKQTTFHTLWASSNPWFVQIKVQYK